MGKGRSGDWCGVSCRCGFIEPGSRAVDFGKHHVSFGGPEVGFDGRFLLLDELLNGVSVRSTASCIGMRLG